jgi:putative RecB family exonuclease
LFEAGSVAEGQWLDGVAQLVRRWFTLEDPRQLEPAERELFVSTSLSDGLVLRGYVDRLDVLPDGSLQVVDYKTGRSPAPGYEQKAWFQMKFYALVLWRLRSVVPAQLRLVYLGDGKVLTYEPKERDLITLERKVLAIWRAIDRATTSGDWRPSTGKLCDWCAHKAICPAWGGVPPALAPAQGG